MKNLKQRIINLRISLCHEFDKCQTEPRKSVLDARIEKLEILYEKYIGPMYELCVEPRNANACLSNMSQTHKR